MSSPPPANSANNAASNTSSASLTSNAMNSSSTSISAAESLSHQQASLALAHSDISLVAVSPMVSSDNVQNASVGSLAYSVPSSLESHQLSSIQLASTPFDISPSQFQTAALKIAGPVADMQQSAASISQMPPQQQMYANLLGQPILLPNHPLMVAAAAGALPHNILTNHATMTSLSSLIPTYKASKAPTMPSELSNTTALYSDLRPHALLDSSHTHTIAGTSAAATNPSVSLPLSNTIAPSNIKSISTPRASSIAKTKRPAAASLSNDALQTDNVNQQSTQPHIKKEPHRKSATEASRASRERQRQHLEHLERRIQDLSQTNIALKTQIALVESQKEQWDTEHQTKLMRRIETLEAQINDMTQVLISCAASKAATAMRNQDQHVSGGDNPKNASHGGTPK